jgi:hypothetical protein
MRIASNSKTKIRARKIKELDGLLALYVKTRDQWTCWKSGQTRAQGYQMQAAHILGKGAHPRLRFEPENIMTLGATAHRWWHDSSDGLRWLETIRPGLHERLLIADRCAPKIDLDLLLIIWRKLVDTVASDQVSQMGGQQ